MANIGSLAYVGIFTRDRKRAREFYTRKIGLAVREAIPGMGFLALGATKGGKDASVNLWQPDPATWGEDYEPSAKQIGTVTGVGFVTSSVDKTVDMLRRRKVKVEVDEDDEERLARFEDLDGNVLFAFEPSRPKVRRAGLSSLGFVTIVSRDRARTDSFYTKALGLRKTKAAGEEFDQYRVSPGGTALMPFTPNREMYDDPKDFDADMAHAGENTWIMFTTRDLVALQDQLMARGVRFKRKAERADWGGMEAEFLDPDDNVYWLMQPRPRAR